MISMRDAFGKALMELGEKRRNFVVLDADVCGGTGTAPFREAFPDRFIQCGIAEQNMVSLAAGLASCGIIPIVTCYAFAALRAAEQIRNSIAYPDFPVKIVVSHLGLDVGPDGATHQAVEDIAVFRSMPNLAVVAPADPCELYAILPYILDIPKPFYMRTGRSPLPDVFAADARFTPGKAIVLREGRDIAILAVGVMVKRAVEAAELLEQDGIHCRVLNVSWLKPLDQDTILAAAHDCGAIVTCEDHNRYGGLGGGVAELLSTEYPVPLRMVALDDCYGESGDPAALAEKYGLTAPHIALAAREALRRKVDGK